MDVFDMIEKMQQLGINDSQKSMFVLSSYVTDMYLYHAADNTAAFDYSDTNNENSADSVSCEDIYQQLCRFRDGEQMLHCSDKLCGVNCRNQIYVSKHGEDEGFIVTDIIQQELCLLNGMDGTIYGLCVSNVPFAIRATSRLAR